jgi:hypothetical protein
MREYQKGWGAAEREILRAREDRRGRLAHLARVSGVQGAASLGYLVKRMRFEMGEGEAPKPGVALGWDDAAFVERRARELVGVAA